MASEDSELNNVLAELNYLSLRRQELVERRNIKCIINEMKNRADFQQTEEAASNLHDIEIIDDTLKQLSERKAALQKSLGNSLNVEDVNKEATASCEIWPDVPEPCIFVEAPPEIPAVDIFYVEAPPDKPAPEVILDVKRLPAYPCRTQCPECKQFIMTEIFTSVYSGTWLVCFTLTVLCCIAGCCLIPFCMKQCKAITHKCPRCRTKIMTIKKL